MNRDIETYLKQLQGALAAGGADPALVQDALFDAEEHLQSELAAGTLFDGIIFNAGAAPFRLSGNLFNLAGNVVNYSTNTQTIALPVALARRPVQCRGRSHEQGRGWSEMKRSEPPSPHCLLSVSAAGPTRSRSL